ncbi:hypothetical protein HQ571_01625 [Candidatus Kuenenbacteria bacterium]|nr:hypothetical protein [Candidatus Kuenenbacteria bacterium]
MNEYDPYPKFSEKNKAWFMSLIEGMVKYPKTANYARIKSGNDLEIAILVAPEDADVFTPEVCNALKVLLAKVTGVLSPVVYLFGAPHAVAEEAIRPFV